MRFKTYINILLVLVISAVLLVIWIHGLNWVYSKLLVFFANVLLIVSPHTHISLENQEGEVYFIVRTIIEGRNGSYPQKATLIILPFIMMLTWQILLFINISLRKALRSTIENLVIFIFFQVIYLLILTGYYNSNADKFFFHLLVDSFYIIGLFLIVKDTIRYRLISFPGGKESSG